MVVCPHTLHYPSMILIALVLLVIVELHAVGAAATPKRKPQVFVPPSDPDYNDLDKKDPSKLHEDPQFISACKELAG